jgi:hypothetical protein
MAALDDRGCTATGRFQFSPLGPKARSIHWSRQVRQRKAVVGIAEPKVDRGSTSNMDIELSWPGRELFTWSVITPSESIPTGSLPAASSGCELRSKATDAQRKCAKVIWRCITQQLSQFFQSLFPAAVAKKLPRAFLVIVKKDLSLYSSIPRRTSFGRNIRTFLPALA